MSTISGNLTLSTNFRQSADGIGGSKQSYGGSQNYQTAFDSSGTPGAADQANLKYTRVLSLAAAPTVLDLQALTDDTGAALSFARIRSLTIRVRSVTDADVLEIEPGGTNGWTNMLATGSTLKMRASTSSSPAVLAITAPSATGYVVDSTHKTLSLDPGASTFTVDVEIVGCSA